jgi:hypothetical protein
MTLHTVYKVGLYYCLAIFCFLLNPDVALCNDTASKRVEQLESGFYYTIQKGDTLWDLSHHFFDSPWIWPDLWGKNQDISNPHWIYPGDRIRLYKRTGNEQVVTPTAPSHELQDTGSKKPIYFFYPAIDSVGFVKKAPVHPSGAIFSVKEDKFMISIGDLVYIRPESETRFQSGDRYTIFRTMELQELESGSDFGVQHYLVGMLEITRVEPSFSLGKIIESYRHIEVGDLLMPYKARSKKIALKDSKPGLEGRIVAPEEDHAFFAHHTIIFINKGRQDGIEKGQTYRTYYQDSRKPDPDNNEEILLSPVNFGEIFVLHTEPTTATAVVTSAEKAIEPGTKIH